MQMSIFFEGERMSPEDGDPEETVSREWKLRVKAAIEASAWNVTSLARELGVNQGGLSRFLDPENMELMRSSYAPKVARLLSVPIVSEERTRWRLVGERLMEAAPSYFGEILEALEELAPVVEQFAKLAAKYANILSRPPTR
jgi:hypothetical protein